MVVVGNGSDLSLQGGRCLGEISVLLLLFGQSERTEGNAVTEINSQRMLWLQSCPSTGDTAQLTTHSRRERVQMQEGYNRCVCFPVLFVLRALMGADNVGVPGRIGLVWGTKVH